MPCILFGYLTFKPHSLVGSAATGSLFVEDNLGALVCEVGIYSTLYCILSKMCLNHKSFSVVEEHCVLGLFLIIPQQSNFSWFIFVSRL